jgi:hypothetical protein
MRAIQRRPKAAASASVYGRLTLTLRCLHRKHPARDFLWYRRGPRGRGSEIFESSIVAAQLYATVRSGAAPA